MIIIQNLLGWDDKDLLLYFTTPLLLFLNEWTSFRMSFFGEHIRLAFYVCNFLTWFLIGLVLDKVLYHIASNIKRKT